MQFVKVHFVAVYFEKCFRKYSLTSVSIETKLTSIMNNKLSCFNQQRIVSSHSLKILVDHYLRRSREDLGKVCYHFFIKLYYEMQRKSHKYSDVVLVSMRLTFFFNCIYCQYLFESSLRKFWKGGFLSRIKTFIQI
jgi:hypothetical protein